MPVCKLVLDVPKLQAKELSLLSRQLGVYLTLGLSMGPRGPDSPDVENNSDLNVESMAQEEAMAFNASDGMEGGEGSVLCFVMVARGQVGLPRMAAID